MVQATIITTANAKRWQAALDRAISNALDVLVSTSGEAFVESASVPGLLYSVSREVCTCPAGAKGQPCKHRACYLAQIGELEITPDPAGITFTGNSDRQEILIDGEFYGDAAYWEDTGWTLFRGAFPHARRIGTYCTISEIERGLAAMLPLPLPLAPSSWTVDMAGLVAAA